ncbi:TetR/AcrR family transcriptional regulator C-terminal domain-containing protein [Sorangium sp. So ce1153]|uniref:TetR/AcrR family transcriptional regulator C-terminal domain-containing protein n=1 Tax=Sorangium sp. So ce1153 TaxID=3133333 RepID=UPI003F628EE5
MNRAGDQPEPPSVQIAGELRRRILAGELRAGERVPSTRQITEAWGVAIATATKALSMLQREGLVRAVPGVGTVVAPREPAVAPPVRAPRRREARDAEHAITRERVVQAAIDLADAEGLAALSMRRIAAELDVATMSLYRHVPGKDELVLLMVDAAFSETRLPEPPPPGWRARVEVAARLQWALYRRHPWLAPALSMTRPQLIPSGMAHTEWLLRAIDGLGLDLGTMLRVAITMAGYVRGVATSLESEAQAEQDTGVTSDEWMASRQAKLEAIVASGDFPTIARLATEPDHDTSLDTLFELGLGLMLDGIAALIERARAQR